MRDKALKTIADYHMIHRGDSLFAGVSGGADSVALLHFLRQMAGEWELKLTALHLNHRLRGAESDRDEQFVRQLCRDWKIPLKIASRNIGELAAEQGLSVEECARNQRYAFFREESGGGITATAHTLNDSAETLLLNLTRGTALRGLCGIPPVRDAIIRPLVRCTRLEIEAYCEENHLEYVTDSTNADTAYTRNRLRHQVLPVLEKLNPGLLEQWDGMMTTLRQDADYLDHLAREMCKAVESGGDTLDRALLLEQPEPMLMRVLLLQLQRRQIPAERRRLEQMRSLIRQGTGAVQLGETWTMRCSRNEVQFCENLAPVPQVHVTIEKEKLAAGRLFPLFSGKSVRITSRETEIFEESINNIEKPLKNKMDYDKIGKIITLRRRNPGDSIRLAGRGCTKSLKKLFNEAGLPIRQREETLVLEEENGSLLWVEGFGTAEHAAVTESTGRVMVLEILEDTPCTQM